MATTVEVIADAMQAAGTPFITGHPGGESVELMEAARQRDMRFLLFKQEVAAAMMAATWGELTGSPGLCLSTRGPGASNMVNVTCSGDSRSPPISTRSFHPNRFFMVKIQYAAAGGFLISPLRMRRGTFVHHASESTRPRLRASSNRL